MSGVGEVCRVPEGIESSECFTSLGRGTCSWPWRWDQDKGSALKRSPVQVFPLSLSCPCLHPLKPLEYIQLNFHPGSHPASVPFTPDSILSHDHLPPTCRHGVCFCSLTSAPPRGLPCDFIHLGPLVACAPWPPFRPSAWVSLLHSRIFTDFSKFYMERILIPQDRLSLTLPSQAQPERALTLALVFESQSCSRLSPTLIPGESFHSASNVCLYTWLSSDPVFPNKILIVSK